VEVKDRQKEVFLTTLELPKEGNFRSVPDFLTPPGTKCFGGDRGKKPSTYHERAC
jgi:hypothetical protein